MKNPDEFNSLIKNSSLDRNKGYQIAIENLSVHPGYIIKGDNNQISDEGSSLSHYVNLGPIEPVKPDWIVGKALFHMILFYQLKNKTIKLRRCRIPQSFCILIKVEEVYTAKKILSYYAYYKNLLILLITGMEAVIFLSKSDNSESRLSSINGSHA